VENEVAYIYEQEKEGSYTEPKKVVHNELTELGPSDNNLQNEGKYQRDKIRIFLLKNE
jgi:hypothetical protein